MNFPKELKYLKDGTVYIFGEAITTRENFKRAKGNYKHSRNFAVGTLRPILTMNSIERYLRILNITVP